MPQYSRQDFDIRDYSFSLPPAERLFYISDNKQDARYLRKDGQICSVCGGDGSNSTRVTKTNGWFKSRKAAERFLGKWLESQVQEKRQ